MTDEPDRDPRARFSIAAQHDAAASAHVERVVRAHVDVMTAVLEGHAFAVCRMQHLAEFYASEARRFYAALEEAHDVSVSYQLSDVHKWQLAWLSDMTVAAQQHAWAFSLAARALHHHA